MSNHVTPCLERIHTRSLASKPPIQLTTFLIFQWSDASKRAKQHSFLFGGILPNWHWSSFQRQMFTPKNATLQRPTYLTTFNTHMHNVFLHLQSFDTIAYKAPHRASNKFRHYKKTELLRRVQKPPLYVAYCSAFLACRCTWDLLQHSICPLQ